MWRARNSAWSMKSLLVDVRSKEEGTTVIRTKEVPRPQAFIVGRQVRKEYEHCMEWSALAKEKANIKKKWCIVIKDRTL